MADTAARHGNEGGENPLAYPTNRVVGAVDRSVLGAVVPDLIEAGFAPVGILAGEAGLRRIRESAGGEGLVGLLRRLSKSTGGELDHLQRAEQDLRDGHALIDVEIVADDQKDLARSVLLRHGGHSIAFFGPWSIETLT